MLYNDRKKYAQELVRMDKYADALREYGILYKEDRKDPDNLKQINFLWTAIIKGNYDFEPLTAEQFVMRGAAKFYHGEVEKALTDYTAAVELDSNSDYALHSRGLTYQFLGKLEYAVSDLNKAIQLNPLGEYYDNLACAYSDAGNSEESLKAHKKATELASDEPIHWYHYGCELTSAGKISEAIKMFDKAIELDPDYEDAIVNRKYLLNHGKNMD